jgi:hypothetical protein
MGASQTPLAPVQFPTKESCCPKRTHYVYQQEEIIPRCELTSNEECGVQPAAVGYRRGRGRLVPIVLRRCCASAENELVTRASAAPEEIASVRGVSPCSTRPVQWFSNWAPSRVEG